MCVGGRESEILYLQRVKQPVTRALDFCFGAHRGGRREGLGLGLRRRLEARHRRGKALTAVRLQRRPGLSRPEGAVVLSPARLCPAPLLPGRDALLDRGFVRWGLRESSAREQAQVFVIG